VRVFISHSGKDKWAARVIAKELGRLGVSTFLDEKDIETGESIDVSIKENIRDCDHFLVVLSPASINSHWVLVEIGHALALEKRLVPILLYVGSNEIPPPISKHLARDINEVDRYFVEVKKALAGEVQEPVARLKPERQPLPKKTFSVGDRVRIASTPQPTATRTGVNINWKGAMDHFCGRLGVVMEMDDDRSCKLDVDGGHFWWALEWLSLEQERGTT